MYCLIAFAWSKIDDRITYFSHKICIIPIFASCLSIQLLKHG